MGDMVKRQKIIKLYGVSEHEAINIVGDLTENEDVDIKFISKDNETHI